jgi:hypothetical protein
MKTAKIARTGAFVVVVALLGAAPRRGKADDAGAVVARSLPRLVQSVAAATEELRNDEDRASVVVPWTLSPGVPPETLAVRTTSVSTNGTARGGMWRDFPGQSVTLEGGTRALSIDVSLDRVDRPGTYDVTVAVTSPAMAGVEQELVVHVVLAKASLRAVEPLIFEQTLWPFVAPGALSPAAVTLHETSGDAAVRKLRIEQVGAAVHDDRVLTTRVSADAPPMLAHEGWGDVKFTASGAFPPGVSRGHLEMESPSLGAPARIDYEVHARYPSWLLVPIFLLGGLLGWAYRIYLRQREQLHATTLAAADLLKRSRAEEARNPTDERADLTEARGGLEAAIGSRDAARIAAAAKTVEGALQVAIKARTDLRTEMLRAAGKLLGTLDTAWRLPPQAELGGLRALAAKWREQLLSDDLRGAATLEGELKVTERGLRDVLGKWSEGAAGTARQLTAPERPVPASIRQGLQEGDVKLLADSLAGARASSEDPQAPLDRILASVHLANCTSVRFAEWLADEASRTADAISTASPKESFKQRVPELRRLVPSRPVTDIRSAFEQLDQVLSALHRLVVEEVPEGDAPRVAALGRGDYVAALRAPAVKTAAQGIVQVGIGDAPAVAPAAAPVQGPALDRAADESPTLMMTQALMVVSTETDSTSVLEVQQARQLVIDHLLIGVVTALVSSMAAWAAYGSTWVGSAADVLGVFAVAFTSDFTVVTALEQIGRAKPPMSMPR